MINLTWCDSMAQINQAVERERASKMEREGEKQV